MTTSDPGESHERVCVRLQNHTVGGVVNQNAGIRLVVIGDDSHRSVARRDVLARLKNCGEQIVSAEAFGNAQQRRTDSPGAVVARGRRSPLRTPSRPRSASPFVQSMLIARFCHAAESKPSLASSFFRGFRIVLLRATRPTLLCRAPILSLAELTASVRQVRRGACVFGLSSGSRRSARIAATYTSLPSGFFSVASAFAERRTTSGSSDCSPTISRGLVAFLRFRREYSHDRILKVRAFTKGVEYLRGFISRSCGRYSKMNEANGESGSRSAAGRIFRATSTGVVFDDRPSRCRTKRKCSRLPNCSASHHRVGEVAVPGNERGGQLVDSHSPVSVRADLLLGAP